MVRDTSFREAVGCFQEFLVGQGLSPVLLWVFREDIVRLSGRLAVNVAVAKENNSLAESLYKIGQERGFGVALHAFALLGECPLCYIELPEDELDAQYRLMSGADVKYTIHSDLRRAEAAPSLTLWTIYRLREQFAREPGRVIEDLPSRNFARV